MAGACFLLPPPTAPLGAVEWGGSGWGSGRSGPALSGKPPTPTLPAPMLGCDEIRAIREREQVSQPVFAAYLNVSRNLVSDWERGIKRAGGPALRLLSIVKRKGLEAVA